MSASPNKAKINNIVFLVLPAVEILDLGGPAQVFDTAKSFGGSYQISYAGPSTNVKSAQGIQISISAELPTVDQRSLVVVPGIRGVGNFRLDRETLEWLRKADRAGAAFASICSGAFILGAAGLLDGRRCTTHWSLTAALGRAYPAVKVQDAELFVQDGRVVTSAGIASGIDMALYILETDLGPLVAARVAREMVVYLRREGKQRQTSIYLDYRTHLHPGIHKVQDWMITHFGETVLLEKLGRLAGLSGRQFARVFKAATGITPLAFQQRLRLEHATSLLNDPNLTMEAIASRCGFEDGRSLRRLWNSTYGHSPSRHRAISEA